MVRRDAAMAILAEEPAMRVIPPDGAFYLFIQAPGAGSVPEAGTVFAARLLEKHNVAVVPGAAFLAPDWIRVAYSTDIEQVKTAMRRIVTAFRER